MCRDGESNSGHQVFQTCALPAELSRQAGRLAIWGDTLGSPRRCGTLPAASWFSRGFRGTIAALWKPRIMTFLWATQACRIAGARAAGARLRTWSTITLHRSTASETRHRRPASGYPERPRRRERLLARASIDEARRLNGMRQSAVLRGQVEVHLDIVGA